MNIASKDSVKHGKIVKVKSKALKTGLYKGKLQTKKNLSVFNLKFFFFIKAFLLETR